MIVSGDNVIATLKVQHRASLTEPAQVAELMRAIHGHQGTMLVSAALRMLPLVFARPGELRTAEWAEFDLAAAEWRIPTATTKMRTPHLVPLPAQAVAILQDLQPLTGAGRYVFPSALSRLRPMSENTINAALRRLGFSKDQMTVHGLGTIGRGVGEPILAVLAEVADMERLRIVERCESGRQAARSARAATGRTHLGKVSMGRPMAADAAAVIAWKRDNAASIAATAQQFGISDATVKRYARQLQAG